MGQLFWRPFPQITLFLLQFCVARIQNAFAVQTSTHSLSSTVYSVSSSLTTFAILFSFRFALRLRIFGPSNDHTDRRIDSVLFLLNAKSDIRVSPMSYRNLTTLAPGQGQMPPLYPIQRSASTSSTIVTVHRPIPPKRQKRSGQGLQSPASSSQYSLILTSTQIQDYGTSNPNFFINFFFLIFVCLFLSRFSKYR